MLAILLLCSVQTATASAPDPAAIVRRVERAVANGVMTALEDSLGRAVLEERATDRARFGLATVARLTYDYPAARTGLRRLATSSSDGAVRVYAGLGLAAIDVVHGDLRRAREQYADAVRLAGELDDPPGRADALVGLARLAVRSEGPEAALRLLDRADSTRGPDAEVPAVVSCVRGRMMSLRGVPGGMDVMTRGLHRAQAAGDLRAEGSCWLMRAQERLRRGDVGAAVVPFGRSVAAFRAAGDLANLAVALQIHGYNQYAGGRLRDARDLLLQADDAADRSGAGLVQGWVALDLALVANTFRDYRAASGYAHRADSIFREVGDVLGDRSVRGFRADLLVRLGAFHAAVATFDSLIEWADGAGLVQWSNGYRSGLAHARILSGDLAGADTVLTGLREIAQRAGMPGWLTPVDLDRAFVALRRGRYADAQALVSGHSKAFSPDQARARFEITAMRAEAAWGLGQTDLAVAILDSAATQLERQRQRLSGTQLQQLVFQGGTLQRGQVSAVNVIGGVAGMRPAAAFRLAESRRARSLQDRMVVASALRGAQAGAGAGSSAGARGTTVPMVQAGLLDHRTALVEFVTGPWGASSAAIVVTRDTTFGVTLPPVVELDGLIEQARIGLEERHPVDTPLRRLGRELLDPWLAGLPGEVTRLLVVPDGPLHRLPFEALRLSDGRFVLERYEIAVIPSAGVALALRAEGPRSGPTTLLAIGDPAYGTVPPAYRDAFADAGGLARLRGSGREARRVARYAPASTLWRRDRASEAALKGTDLSSYSVVHFATHALVDEGSALRTVLAVAPGDGEDGFIDPGELAGLGIAADLVFLSGCRTAGGHVVSGEGLTGLTSPLLASGTRSVVGTRWAVGDREIQKQVRAVYDRLAGGESVGRAVHLVKKDLLRHGAHPGVWAVLSVIGDPDVTVPLEAPPWWKFW